MLVTILLLLACITILVMMFGIGEGEPGACLFALLIGAAVFVGFGEHHDLKMQADNADTYQAYYEKAMDANKVLTGKLKTQKSLTSEYRNQVKHLGDQVDTLQGDVMLANQRTSEVQEDLQEAQAKLERVKELTGGVSL